ncbi:hypothetical protein ACWDSD_32840 [Streptomyces spiralis]
MCRREDLHPTQDRRVTDALIAGDRTPLRENGKELKVQVFPDQFPRWFSVPLATGGEARHDVAHLLAAPAHHSLVLSHDVTANADFLPQLVDLPAS